MVVGIGRHLHPWGLGKTSDTGRILSGRGNGVSQSQSNKRLSIGNGVLLFDNAHDTGSVVLLFLNFSVNDCCVYRSVYGAAGSIRV